MFIYMPIINKPGNYIVEATRPQGCENSSIRLEILQQEPDDTNWVSVGQDGDNFTIDVERLEDGRSANATIGAFFTPEGGSEMRCTNNDITVTIDASCDCDDLTITRAPYSATPVSSDGEDDALIASYTKDECIQYTSLLVSVPSDCDWVEGLDIDNSGDVYGTILPNTDTSARTVTVTIKYTAGGAPCTKEFTVKQAEYDPGCNCSTSKFAVNKTAISVSSGGATSISSTRRIAWTAECGTVTAEITSGNEWLGFHSTTGEKYRYITAATNTTDIERVGTVKISLDNDSECYSSVTVTQSAGTDCNCNSLSLGDTSTTISSGSSTSITVSSGACIGGISVTSSVPSVATATTENGSIKITGLATGFTVISVSYTAIGTDCPNKTIGVTVKCPTIEISPKDGGTTSEGGIKEFTIN